MNGPDALRAIIRTVRAAVGDDITLLADGNSGFTPKRAIEVGRLMEDHHYGAPRGAMPLLGIGLDGGGCRGVGYPHCRG